jgi:hypothetical protein
MSKDQQHRRWFWRIRHRFGDRWTDMTETQIRREMRMRSWRRAI